MKKLSNNSVFFCWSARVIGSLTVLLFLVFALGEGVPEITGLSLLEKIMFIGLATAIIGLIVAWRWTLTGCLMILTGYLVFVICNKGFNVVSPFSLFPMVVALYTTAWIFDRSSDDFGKNN